MEALVTTVIMGIVSTAFMAVLLVNYKTNAKVDNMQDTLNAVRAIKERISKDVREGRSLGDIYGSTQVDHSYIDPTTGQPSTMVVGSDGFPSTNDPLYSTGAPAIPGWPTATTGSPYRLSNQCLVVQVPILDDHQDTAQGHFRNTAAVGWPTQIPNPNGLGPQDNVETHVYRVVQDPDTANHPGEWLLQYASFGGASSALSNFTGYNPTVHTFGPQTLVAGVIGPLDANGNPKVFQFISPKRSGTPVDSIPNPSFTAEYTGVVCNLEVKRHQDMSATQKNFSVTPTGMKIEVFLRNNALATSAGAPNQ
jgi:hypothetical protein